MAVFLFLHISNCVVTAHTHCTDEQLYCMKKNDFEIYVIVSQYRIKMQLISLKRHNRSIKVIHGELTSLLALFK